jgi:hypothetical protein
MRTLLPIFFLTVIAANAQVPPAFSCSGNSGIPRIVQADGLTELTGDVVITCTGGVPTAAGARIPAANISLFLNTNITSRLLASTWSEALLLLDEPSPSSQFACETSTGVCNALGDGSGSGKYYGPGSSGTAGNNKNVFQGQQTSGNGLTWSGVPIDPPGANGSRVIRITNIRANANALGASANTAPAAVVASISINSPTSIGINNPTSTVAFVQSGLTASTRNAGNTADVTGPVSLSGCAAAQTKIATLRYTERYATAFTRRNVGTTASLPSNLAPQNNLTTTYQTQTGFYNPNLSGAAARGNLGDAGVPDSGTRLKAVFKNIPSGVNLSVNVSDVPGKARLTNVETGAFTFVSLADPAQLIVQNGSATAVWEVLGDDPNAIEQFDFGVYASLSADVSATGAITVNRTVAPSSTIATASLTAPVPRYADASTASNLLTFTACTTTTQYLSLDKLSPASATVGGPGFTLTVFGASFVSGAKVQWNGLSLTTGFGGATQLTAAVPANLLAQPGAANISVVNPNGSRTNTLIFPINSSGSPYTLSAPSLNFQYTTSGGQAQTKQIEIRSSAGPPVGFTAGISLDTPAAANWLRVDPTSGVTPATVNVTVNPAGLKPGIYIGSVVISASGSITVKSSERSAAGDAVVTVTLVISDDKLSFTFLTGGPRPAAKGITVASLSVVNARFLVSFAVLTPPSGWLSVSPADTNAPTTVSVSVDPSGLPPGTYVGGVTLSPADSSTAPKQVPVTLTVVAQANQTLNFSFQSGGATPAPQSFTSGGAGIVSPEAISDGSWLSVNPSSGNSPATFSCSVNPAGLAPGTLSGLVIVTDANTTPVYVVQVNLTVTAASVSSTQIISHIADGAKWKTTIILVNLDAVPAPFILNFWKDDGTAYPISLTGRGTLSTVSDTIPAGGSRTIESDGTASALGTGWAEVISSQSIGGTAIFRDQNLNQEAAVPLLSSSAARVLLPFETGAANLNLGVALANPSQTQDITVTGTLRNGQGQVITSSTTPLARHGHTAFVLSNPSSRPEDQRGVLELSSSAGQVFALGIRGNNGAFTSIEALTPQDPKNKVISHIANGQIPGSGSWKTTIVLVNTASSPVQFTVNFFKDDGSPLTVTLVDGRSLSQVVDAIPVGGSRTIETDGLASAGSTGWAEVLSGQSIGGTAIFREQTLRQEAAVPLLASGGTRLVLPFDRGLGLGVAMANSNPAQDAGITRTLRNEQGQLITSDAVFLSRHAHTSFVLTNPSVRAEDQRGVVEFSSSVEFFSLGIRGNNGAFTSIRALGK